MSGQIKFVSGPSVQMEVALASSYIIKKHNLLMWTDGAVTQPTSSLGLIDQAVAGFYEGSAISTAAATRTAGQKIQVRVPMGPCIVYADTSGTWSTATIGNQYGIATSEASSGYHNYIGVANVDYGNFIHLRGTNSSGKNYFLLLPGTAASTT